MKPENIGSGIGAKSAIDDGDQSHTGADEMRAERRPRVEHFERIESQLAALAVRLQIEQREHHEQDDEARTVDGEDARQLRRSGSAPARGRGSA